MTVKTLFAPGARKESNLAALIVCFTPHCTGQTTPDGDEAHARHGHLFNGTKGRIVSYFPAFSADLHDMLEGNAHVHHEQHADRKHPVVIKWKYPARMSTENAIEALLKRIHRTTLRKNRDDVHVRRLRFAE